MSRRQNIKGSTVLVFGGSSGIGKAVATGVAALGAARIFIVGRNIEKLESAKREIEAEIPVGTVCEVSYASVDVTDEDAVRSYLQGFSDDSIDHLVTTPGGSARLGNLIANDRTCDDVRKQLDMKFFAQLAPVLAIGKKIKRGGSITMTSGVLSRRTGRGNDALAISNAAIECAVRCLANDFGYDGRMVRVNCLSPGMTLTPVYGNSDAANAYQKKTAANVPLQRNAKAEEQADVVLFLMSNTFMTGQVIDCDGGNVIAGSTSPIGVIGTPEPPGPVVLKQMTILIFGGSDGIGKAVALRVASDGPARIFIEGRNSEKLDATKQEIEAAVPEGIDCQVSYASVDVTDEDAVRSYLQGFSDDSIDHLIITPGGSARLGNLIANERTCNDVRKQLNMKFFAQLAPVLAIGKKIKRGGSITMTSGVLSRRTGRGNDALAISNAAIECAVRCFANDFGYDGRMVRVNCLSPGMTITDVYADLKNVVDYQRKIASNIPLQRNALPQEQAHVVHFLLTNTFITGVTIDCDGGNVISA